MASQRAWTWLLLLMFLAICGAVEQKEKLKVCVVGSGIGGASAAHFLRNYSGKPQSELEIHIYERNAVAGGRMAVVNLSGDLFEAGASILHPKNYHTVHFVELLGLEKKTSADSQSFGIWDGHGFVFKTLSPGSSALSQKITSWINSLSLLWRYGLSLFQMDNFVSQLLERFLHFYDENRPPYSSVVYMLQSVQLYEYTQNEFYKEILREGLSPLLVNELVTVITRINYGQDVKISGLAGSVSLCGSGDDLWAVKGGNFQMATGLIKHSNASLRLNDTVLSIENKDGAYQVSSSSGDVELYDAVIIATPLDEVRIDFSPSITIPERSMHHTHATFVRGLLSPAYFGVKSLPDLVATLELEPDLPFISISVLTSYSNSDKAYKVFSREELSEGYLDELFSVRKETIRFDWAAYPEFRAPEVFAPIVLDEQQLYYINSFENAASTMETSAVAAENVARLVLSRLLPGGNEFNSGLLSRTESVSNEL